jgi:two-component system, OmpR family, sensor kinase
MSLTGRFSALFLGALGLVLIIFSTVLYVSARIHLDRRVRERLAASLAVLAAAAEIHPEGVEWEPHERVLSLGQEPGPDRLRWIVFDDQGRRIDHSRNEIDAELTIDWVSNPGGARLPSRLMDRSGRSWQIAQRRLRPGEATSSGSHAASGRGQLSPDGPSETLHPALVLTVFAPLDPKESTLGTLAWLLVTLSAGIWLLAALLCRRLSRRALAPVTRMVESARDLNAADPGWCLEEAGTGDELDDLGRAFNDLLSRLHVAYQRQRRFSSDASHQLRTPLTILIGQIEVALRQERSGDEYRRVLKSALGKADQLRQIVEALLFLGRADADAQLIDGELVNLNQWVAEYLAKRPSRDLLPELVQHSAGGEPLPVLLHPTLLGQLLDNLLDNARKYGSPTSPILVETLRDGDQAILAVEDAGSGIPAEELPRVFEPFYRAAPGRRRAVPGAGLGLAIVQRIATALSGTVVVRSELGVGSRFEVRLPIALPAAAPHDAPNNAAAQRLSTAPWNG